LITPDGSGKTDFFNFAVSFFNLTNMKKQAFILFITLIICLGGCRTKNRSEEIKNYAYQEKTVTLSEKMHGKVGAWVEEGTVCYGLIVLVNNKGKVLRGLPIKSKVLSFNADSLKMKALENVSLAEIKGCKKMGLFNGDIWWETQGDLFKTKEEAEAYLKQKGWLQ
jgi:hypothetical protein